MFTLGLVMLSGIYQLEFEFLYLGTIGLDLYALDVIDDYIKNKKNKY